MLRERAKPVSGFTLIEMLVTMVIFGILAALTVPSMKVWIANTRVRAVAESMQNGLRLAQAESLRQSRQVVFALTSGSPTAASPAFTASATGLNWAVVTIPLITGETSNFVQSGILASGVTNVSITMLSGSGTEVCFNSAGRLINQATTGVPGGSCTVPTTSYGADPAPRIAYKITLNSSSGTALADQPLVVEVALGGQVHLCYYAQTLSASNPYGC